ncbi:MAG: AraC family transcriptional regulator [Micromonosporaceae bacterium]|nr:AraC family transcriptional regulator [Micromonosporaceae bacterium]
MHDNLGDQLTVDDMARAAMFSKFHFSRMFQRSTGVSPGRFLAALRLQHAKYLLVSTSLKVVDISIRVGYTSVGTFSSRFTRSVGMSPTAYRRLGGFTPQIPVDGRAVAEAASGVVSGHIWIPPTHPHSLIFIGLFPDRIPEGRPVSCAVLGHSGSYLLDKVPEGVWYVLAQSVTGGSSGRAGTATDRADTGFADPATPNCTATTDCAGTTDNVTSQMITQQEMCVGIHGPITMRRGGVITAADLDLKPVCRLDPPVLLALLDARKVSTATSRRQSAA